MEPLQQRLLRALLFEERKAERVAGAVRLGMLVLFASMAVLNLRIVSPQANAMNFTVLALGFAYSAGIFSFMRRFGYRPSIKYVTSVTDVVLVFLLLAFYAQIDAPAAALKNYVFLVLFPIVALTAFRYDQVLTVTTGGLAVILYLLMLLVLTARGEVTLMNAGYDRELFSPDVTIVGQATKVAVLTIFVVLVAYHARYSKRLFGTLVQNELTAREAKEAIDLELRLASQVQGHLLPHDLPIIPGLACAGAVRQGRAVGGDYYDLLELPNSNLLVVIADVSGKGTPAALIMAEVRAAVHVLAADFSDLETLVMRLNHLIHRSTDRKTFVTMLAVQVDRQQQILRYICSGHPPPVIATAHSVRTLTGRTLALGVRDSLPAIAAHEVPFISGDLLVCCTDGILEHTNGNDEEYGMERLSSFISQRTALNEQSMIDEIFQDVAAFGMGRDPDDDATIAVVRALAIG